MTKHTVGECIIHADARWNNGNSPVGLMIAAQAFKAGRPTPDHIVHPATETCDHC